MDKKKVIVIGVAIIAVILIAAGAIAAILHNSTDLYTQRIEAGYRYLESGDYEQAIVMFNQAIEMDNSREDAHLGLYSTYVKMGDNEMAKRVIRAAVGVSDSDRIQKLLEQIEEMESGNGSSKIESGLLDDENVEVVDKGYNLVLNVEMLEIFCSTNYSDYIRRYGSPSVTMVSGNCQVRVDGLPALLIYSDSASERVIDQTRGEPYDIYLPTQIRMDNITTLFGGKAITYDALSQIQGISALNKEDNNITFTYKNCKVCITCDSKGQIKADSANTITITEQVRAASQHTVVTTVVDATTGLPVADVEVRAYANSWEEVARGRTDRAGIVELDVENSGLYTLEFSKTGFITETSEVYVYATMDQITTNFSIVPVGQENVIRFVLSWSSSPVDLDSYLIGTSSDGTATYVSFRNMQQYDSSGRKIAGLDVDDMDGYGPETITLYDTDGFYKFCVVDYWGSGMMSYSPAQVKIYVGSELYTTVDVPSGLENGWHVCNIENGEITVVNGPQATQYGEPK